MIRGREFHSIINNIFSEVRGLNTNEQLQCECPHCTEKMVVIQMGSLIWKSIRQNECLGVGSVMNLDLVGLWENLFIHLVVV